jgi:hypothetical protein
MSAYARCPTEGDCGGVHWHKGDKPDDGGEAPEYAACSHNQYKPCKKGCACAVVVVVNGKETDKEGKKKFTLVYKDDEVASFIPWSRGGRESPGDMLSKDEWKKIEVRWKELGPTATLICACLESKGAE